MSRSFTEDTFMGSITTGIGLISGIDTATLIDQLIALESRGKLTLQNRLARLQQQQTAMLNINSRLLSLKNVAGSFRKNNIFQAALATSSSPDILTATASSKALPGSYTFTVKQLVKTSQQLTKGFASQSTPLGLTELNFNFGNVTLNRDIALEHLNGGQGVRNGKININDAAGNQASIDLTAATTMNDVLDAINSSSGVSVTATLDGDRLVIEDTSGGGGSLTVTNAPGAHTATDLGIAGSSAEGVITGSSIHYLGGSTSLNMFNDGTGALIRDNVTDLRVTARNGQVFNLDFGRKNLNITSETKLSDLNNGSGVTISTDHDNPDVKFVARDGQEYEVNLTGVTTVGELISRVNNATNGQVQLEVTDGERLSVIDNSGGDGPLKILGTGINGTQTAEDLGILNEDGVDADSFLGEIIPNTLADPTASTIQELIDRVNEQTSGAISLAIAEGGRSLKFIDNTGGSGELKIEATGGNPHLARQLGLETSGVEQDEVAGKELIASLGSVLVRNLNGGNGLGDANSIDITDRAGNSTTIAGLDQFASLDQLIAHINEQAVGAGVSITASVNAAGTGLRIEDTSGGSASNLIIAGDAAAALGIEADTASTTVHGKNLDHQFISESTLLSDMNYGRGIGAGSFRITDGFGKTATINVTANHKTLYDVIQNINGQAAANGLAIKARVNDNGSGLLIEEDLPDGASPSVHISVTSISGTTAKDLNILGKSDTIHGGAFIDGGYARSISLNETDTLANVVAKINEAGIPISASILKTGSGSNPYRISFTSAIAGANGELVIDAGGVDLGLATLTRGQDAKVFFGEPGSESSFLITSSTNTVKDAVDGLTLNLLSASDSPVTVTIARDVEKITKQVEDFVKALNDAIARIDEYDFYDLDAEKRGILLGNPTTSRIRNALFRAVQQPAEGVTTQYQRLHEIGIRVVADGKIEFNQSVFQQAYENDPKAVENLLAAYETQPVPPEEIGDGITAGGGGTIATVRGLGQIFDDLLAGLTDNFEGTLKRVDEGFNSQIKLVNSRIEAFDQRMVARRRQLERQFTAMEQSLSQLQGQSGALMSLQNNLQLAGSMFRNR
jgi:flagellar hook-associated protein 2